MPVVAMLPRALWHPPIRDTLLTESHDYDNLRQNNKRKHHRVEKWGFS